MVPVFARTGKSINSFINAHEKWFEKVLTHKNEDPHANYEKFVEAHRNNVLQALQVVSEYAEFYCENDEVLAEHFTYSLKMWKDIIDGYVSIFNDDNFP